MTPKEKALEIVAKYSRVLPMNQTTLLDHKNCTLIALDEIIEVAYWNSVKDFYREVKQEIEKL